MSAKTDNFIKLHKNEVIEATRGTGIFPSVKMAQMIIESSWGEGTAVKKANNYFGIKAEKGYTGDKVALSTPKDAAKVNYFRVYQTASDSIKDHTNFLKQNPRYTKSGVFNAKTPEEQIQAIANAGYAEATHYVPAIMKIINAYKLKDLDKEAGMTSYTATELANKGLDNATEVVKKNPLTMTIVLIAAIATASYFIYKATKKK